MTKRETSLLFVLINLIIVIAGVMTISAKKSSINTNISRIRKYEKSLSDISKNINSISDIIPDADSQISTEPLTIEEVVLQLQKEFSRNGIKVKQYQFTKNGDEDCADISFSCTVSQFFNFLYSQNKNSYMYSIKSLSVKEDKSGISCSLRASNTPCSINSVSSLDRKPYGVESLFPFKEIVTEEKNAGAPTIKEETVKKDTGIFSLVGKTTNSDNSKTIYVKNTRTGKLYVLSEKDIIKESDEAYIININGEKQELLK